MPLNQSQNIETIPGNGASASAGAGKRKAVKKSPVSAAPARGAKKSPPERLQEIVFKELPNPLQPPVGPYLWIDYPQQNERLWSSVYGVRLGVGEAESVEISIDKGPWLPCRLTSGYRWFDWEAISPGRHVLVARMKTADGRLFRTPPRICVYRP